MNNREATHPSPGTRRLAFTLIEMLVVTAIIGILAALIFPVAGSVKKARDLRRTRAEVMLVDTAIRGYNQKLGHNPPDNPANPGTNTLYYELRGTTNWAVQGTTYFQPLDYVASSGGIPQGSLSTVFGIDGFINCTRGTGGDESQPALKFMPEIKAGQYVELPISGIAFRLLGSALDGPYSVVDPATSRKFSPMFYNTSNPTNNPSGFDLWVDIQVGSKLYRVSNWSANYQVLNP